MERAADGNVSEQAPAAGFTSFEDFLSTLDPQSLDANKNDKDVFSTAFNPMKRPSLRRCFILSRPSCQMTFGIVFTTFCRATTVANLRKKRS
jgi:hypothetical protein